MQHKLLHIIGFIILAHCTACAQSVTNAADTATINLKRTDSNFVFIKFILGNYSNMEVDVLDNIFLVTNTNQLKKYKPNGDSVAVFNDVKQFGNLSYLDVSNPLKILLYYKNFSTAVILDRFLGFRNSINFRKQQIFKVKTIATSYDNNIWIFDEQDFKLKKINDDASTISETNDWRQIFDIVPQPTVIIDRDNFVYLYDEEKGFYIFDYYGSLKTNLPLLHWQHVAVNGSKLMGFVDNVLYSYEQNSLNIKTYTLPNFFNGYKDIKAVNGKLYVLKTTGIEIYSIK